jgi:hypothetical protein
MGGTGHTPAFIKAAFATVERAAAQGIRCPQNYTEGITSDALGALAGDGFISIEISGHNWRMVTVLKGPHAGKSTLADPTGGRVFKIIDADGMRMIRKPHLERRRTYRPRKQVLYPRNSDDNPSHRPSG